MGRWAFGTTVDFGSFTGELVDISGPDISRDSIDMTHHGSSNGWREFIAGLKDAGTLSLELQWDTDALPPINGAVDTLTITWPTAGAEVSGATFEVEAFCTAVGVQSPIDDKLMATVEFKLTGEPTFTAAA